MGVVSSLKTSLLQRRINAKKMIIKNCNTLNSTHTWAKMHFLNCEIRVTSLPQSPNFTFTKGEKKVYREKNLLKSGDWHHS